jgi:hypothetical protein
MTKLRRFKRVLANLTDMKFSDTLQSKGAMGEIKIDHEAETLHISVTKDNRGG